MLFYRNLYTKTKKDTVEITPGTQLQPEQKEIHEPLTMSPFVLAERIYIHHKDRFKVHMIID